MDILVDFDGTCVTHEYPRVGKDIGAAPILRSLVACGHNLILFTMRSHKQGISPVTNAIQEGGLNDAIQWFKKNNIPLYGIQTHPTQKAWTDSPKAYGQLIIDDISLGTPCQIDRSTGRKYVDWIAVTELLVKAGLFDNASDTYKK